jgi:signal transduction histidine kinase
MVPELTPGTGNQPPDLSSFCLAITQHAPSPMVTVEGAEHMVRYVNPAFCRLMSKSREELIEKPFAEIMPERGGCLALLNRVYHTGEPENHTEQDGTAPHPRFWSYTVWPVLGAGELLVGVMLQVTETTKFHVRSAEMRAALMLSSVRQHELAEASDVLNAQLQTEIAERKRTEDALRRAQAQLADHAVQLETLVTERTAALRETVSELQAFSYSIAHDMRAPLRSMASFARLVQTEHSEQLDQTGKELLGRVVSSAQRLNHLVTDVLNYSSVTRQKLEMQPVDLEKVLKEAIDNGPEFQPPHAEIEIQTPLHKVIGHEPSLMQCVNSLFSNALKFLLPGVVPRIKVWSEVVNNDVRLWFEDNGIGIAAADTNRVFSLFGRLHPVAEFEGTGIGLTIVRKAMQRMGGKVGVESEPGQGSRFWIQLRKNEDV